MQLKGNTVAANYHKEKDVNPLQNGGPSTQKPVEINGRPAMKSVSSQALPACSEVEAPSKSSVWPRNITCQPSRLT
jgi:hypothetical protein